MAKTNKTNKISRFYAAHPIVSHLILAFVAVCMLGYLALFGLDLWTHHGSVVDVPDVRRMSYQQAVEVLDRASLRAEISDSIYTDTVPPGTVTETWPRAGASVKKGREIYLSVSSFRPRMVSINANLVGVSSRQAISMLENLGIKNIRIVEVPSQFEGEVISARYQSREIRVGARIPVNAAITLEVGSVPHVAFDTDSLDIE